MQLRMRLVNVLLGVQIAIGGKRVKNVDGFGENNLQSINSTCGIFRY